MHIVIEEFSQVKGDQIFLKDIASIQAKPYIREVLETVSLGRSPKPGMMKVLTRARVLSHLRGHPALPKDISVACPDKIYVKQRFQVLEKADIRARVDLFLSDYFTDKAYEIKKLRIQKTGIYPAGELTMDYSSERAVDKNGNLSLSIAVWVDGKEVDSIRIRGKIAVYQKVVCAARHLEKGHPLAQTDVVLVKKDMFSLRGEAVRDVMAMSGQVLKIDVMKHTPIKEDWLVPLPLIRKGEVIVLVARSDHMRIVTSGIAKEDGFKDKMMKVENLGSGKILRGLVREGSTVEVIY
ncbi:MAG: flagellar basal body P-ring formation protein FlgA [Desulfobacter sp.]|nr:flagellar basal body P-ring formation protein FlgA [Desulfobacter sp.]